MTQILIDREHTTSGRGSNIFDHLTRCGDGTAKVRVRVLAREKDEVNSRIRKAISMRKTCPDLNRQEFDLAAWSLPSPFPPLHFSFLSLLFFYSSPSHFSITCEVISTCETKRVFAHALAGNEAGVSCRTANFRCGVLCQSVDYITQCGVSNRAVWGAMGNSLALRTCFIYPISINLSDIRKARHVIPTFHTDGGVVTPKAGRNKTFPTLQHRHLPLLSLLNFSRTFLRYDSFPSW